MDEVAARSVWTEARRVVGATELRLVLGMALKGTNFRQSVRELAAFSIATLTALFKRPAQLRLVATPLAARRRPGRNVAVGPWHRREAQCRCQNQRLGGRDVTVVR